MMPYRSIAVSGTHGKTSTTALIAHMLRASGVNAGYFIGGEVPGWCVSEVPHDVFVAEADESDGTVALYAPDTAVVTNIEYDHMEHFDAPEHVESCFTAFMNQTTGAICFCADDPVAARLCEPRGNAVSYGFSESASLRGLMLAERSMHTRFAVVANGEALGEAVLPMHGAHNVCNALGAYVAVRGLGVSFAAFCDALLSFRPVQRRFEICGSYRGAMVVSDYAHHPTEVAAVLRMAEKTGAKKVVAVFQPHRYTRTLALKEAFASAFDGVDELILCPVYAASEQPIPGGKSADLLVAFEEHDAVEVSLASSLEEAWSLAESALVEDAILLVMGAGDVDTLARRKEIKRG